MKQGSVRLVTWAFWMMVLFSCQPQHSGNQGKIISVSILPQKYLTERIAGNKFTVFVLVPPGASPETYEASPRDIKTVSTSTLFFKIGHFDAEKQLAGKLSQSLKDVKFVDLSLGTNIIRNHEHGSVEGDAHPGIDPHIWSSPKEVKTISKNIFQSLIEIDSGNKQYYEENFAKFTIDLQKLDSTITLKTKNCKRRSFIIYHPALTYFARDYGLIQLSLEAEGKNPSVSQMKELVDKARQSGIKTVFVQSQFDARNAEAIAREIGGHVVVIDPLAGDWLGNMYKMTDAIVNSLNE